MSEEPTWGFRTLAREVFTHTVAKAVWIVGGLVLAGLALWWKGIPDLARGLLGGVALTVVIITLILIWLSTLWRQTRRGWFGGVYTHGPKIVFGDRKFHTKQVGFGNYPELDKQYLETDVISLHFKNTSDKATAEDLHIKFTCIGRGAKIKWIDARLDSFAQPVHGETPQDTFSLEPGEEGIASFVIKEPQSHCCYLFNNDSYKYPRAQNPMWELDRGTYKLLVEFLGPGVVRRFECTFVNRGKGEDSLKIKSSRVFDLFD